ncbi:MAG: DUF72 domain-containing protein [Candidatus Bathyarchaeia archaeon]
MIIKVGCCGFPVSMKKYFTRFKVVEIQKTFYEPPKLETLAKWRENAPEDFEFSVKAWQVLTHPFSSPTWRKMKRTLKKKENYGFLKPTEENFKAWEETLEACKILKAKICVIQTPPSFNCTKENIDNIEEFFKSVNSKNIRVAWEPRGDWINNLDKIKMLCKKLNLIHVVDPLKYEVALTSEIQYFRLHGLHPKKEINYSYKYSIKDLKKLYYKLKVLSEHDINEVYVLFNNLTMNEDAEKFIKIISTVEGENFE